MKKWTSRKRTKNEKIARWEGYRAGLFQGIATTLILVMFWLVLVEVLFK